jgi:hypothetical protein
VGRGWPHPPGNGATPAPAPARPLAAWSAIMAGFV